MKKMLYLIFFLSCTGLYARPYWQQEVNYRIQVTLDDVQHRLKGTEVLTYVNHSPDDLKVIYFHLWANAFSTVKSPFCRQKLRSHSIKFYFADSEKRGGYREIEFRSKGQLLPISYLDISHEMVEVALRSPLKSGESAEIEIRFDLKIPHTFSRLGHVDQSYQMTQWYPKPAVYDSEGWHVMPYLDMGEFYSEFGHYDVQITLPSNYVVGASGTLMTRGERDFVERKIEETKTFLQHHAEVLMFEAGADSIPRSVSSMKTLRYEADQVHDFAWFADKRYLIVRDTAQLPSGKRIPTYGYFMPSAVELWKHSAEYVKDAVEYFSVKIGEYPWPQASAVLGPLEAGGGMEYPMITIIAPTSSARALDGVINHEVGHNWYYGILASNERDHAWMDEGMNSYLDDRYMDSKYEGGERNMLPDFAMHSTDIVSQNNLIHLIKSTTHTDQPGDLSSDDYLIVNYQINAYSNPTIYFHYLEQYVGVYNIDSAAHYYYERWKFKHPTPSDVQEAYEEALGENLDWLFKGLIGVGVSPGHPRHMDYALIRWVNKATNTVEVANRGDIDVPIVVQGIRGGEVVLEKWFKGFEGRRELRLGEGDFDKIAIDYHHISPDVNPENQLLRKRPWAHYRPWKLSFQGVGLNHSGQLNSYILPIVGFNAHDGVMAGLVYHNITLPARPWQYYIAPMYGFGSRSLAGIGDVKYNYYPKGSDVRRIQAGIFGRKFYPWLGGASRLQTPALGRISPYVNMRVKTRMNSLVLHDFTLAADAYIPNGLVYTDVEGSEIPQGSRTRYRMAYRRTDAHIIYAQHIGADLYYARQVENSETGLSAFYRGKWQYMKKKYLNFRLFQGVFLQKSNAGIKNNYYVSYTNGADNVFLDDYFLGRRSTSRIYGKQIQLEEGGFKEPVLIGASRALSALNLEWDIPKVPLVGIFVDQAIGIGDQAADLRYYMSAGVALRMRSLMGIYLPVYHYGFDVAYEQQYPDNTSLWNRLSVQFQLKWNLDDFVFDQLYLN